MTHDNPDTEPLHQRLSTDAALRRLEAATHLSTAGAFILTVVLVSTGAAREANLITAELLSTAGWTATGLLALGVATVTFWYLQRHRRTAPRAVAVGAVLLASLGTFDLAVNVWTVSQVGLPESVLWAEYAAPVAVVGGVGLLSAGRHHFARVVTSPSVRRHAPSPKAVGAVVFAVLLVGSIIGPFAALGGLVSTDHDGVASAQVPDGDVIFSGGYDATVKAFNTGDGSEKWSNDNFSDNVLGLESSPDGSTVVATGRFNDGGVRALNGETGGYEWSYTGQSTRVYQPAWAPDGSMVLTPSQDGSVAALNRADGSEAWRWTGSSGAVRTVAVSPDGSVVWAGDTDGVLAKIDAETGDEITTYSMGSSAIYDIEASADGSVVYVGQQDGTITEVNTDDGSEGWTDSGGSDTVRSLRESSDESSVYAARGSDAIEFDADTGSQGWTNSYGSTITSVSPAADGSVLYAAVDNDVQALDAGDGTELQTYSGHTNTIQAVSSPASPGHPISGTVTDNGGDPVNGATVSTGTGVSTTTGSDGSYSLSVEETGTYDVTAETAIDSDTQTVDVPDGGVTGVNFSLQSGTVAGVVEDQNGNPVADATVTTLTYNTKDPNVDVNLEELREIVENPLPPQWQNFTNQSGVTSEELTVTRENSLQGAVDAADDWDSKRVLMHTPEQWELEGYDWPRNGTVALPTADMLPPQVVVAADNRPVFSCWAPVGDGLLDGVGQNNVGSQLTNLKKSNCDEITVQQLDPTGSVSSTQTYSSTRTLRFQNGFEDITGLGEANYYNSARPDLEPGIYRVYPEDNSDAAMVYAIAPSGDPKKIANNIVNVTNSEIDAKTSYLEEIKAQHDAGNIDIKTTTTNDRGEFSFDIDGSVVEEVELRAAKSGTGLETELASGELNRQQLATDFEDEIRGQFNTFDKSSVRFSEAEVGSQEFADVCRQMGSVADDLGAPYAGTGSTEVPNPDVTITGQRVPIPDGASQPVRQCGLLNYAQSALEDPASLLPGLAGDIAEMAQDELEGHYENIVNLLEGNEDLQAVVEDELGRDLPEDPSELDRDEIETVVRDGLDEVDNPGDGIDVGDDEADSVVPDVPGSDDGDAPSVDDPVEEINDRVNETITREWPITGVDDWEEAGLLIRIDYADGTSETLSRDSEYVTLDESAVGPDTIRLEEFPFGTDDAAVANIRLDVSTPTGIGGEETPVRNPTFDGTVPSLDSIRLSDSAPGPSDAVTVGVTPAEQSQFGQLKTVNVTGPECSRSVDASDGDATFTTCGQGAHRVAVTFENSDGVQFTEVLSVDAGNAAQARDPLIRGAAGPTGRFAVAANGLESGRLDVTAGTSEVILTGIVPAEADVPNRVKASTTGVDVARDATTTVRIRQGPSEQTIRDRIGIVLHTDAVGNESLLWRNGRPIRNPGDTSVATVAHHNDSTSIDTYSSDTATVRVEVDRNPSLFKQFQHSIQLRFAGVDIPFLSIQPTNWLTTLGSLGDGLPAPVQVGGGPLAVLGAGALAARRVGP